MKRFFNLLFVFIISAFILGMIPASPEEGMYPLSEIDKVDLVKAGLKIDPKDIYNPEGISLIDALVNIGGCTGSFISENGLIITNHHCAFGAISSASTVENNYLENGFHAKTLGEEIPARGYLCKITESYEDVSDKILSAVKNITDPTERVKTISSKMRELADAASDEKESIVAEVSEMFAGKTYILFKYRTMRDVRLVYAPPQSIGNFGGETDNWVWPRHTGDFSIMRAYVSKDGKSVPYSPENVPFKPKKFVKINASGINDGDFVFILGYPGRTFRHRPSDYLKYQKEYLLPFISELYEYAINTMQKLSSGDKKLELAYASRMKGLANVMKNYQGKLKGFNRIDLIGNKIAEENEIQKFINQNNELKTKYGNIFNEIHSVYNNIYSYANSDLWLRQVYNFSPSINLANFVLDYTEEIQKPDSERRSTFQEKNLNSTFNRLIMFRSSYNAKLEEIILTKMFDIALKFENSSRISGLSGLTSESIENFIQGTILNSKIMNEDYFNELIKKTPDEISELNDPLINFAIKLRDQGKQIAEQNDKNDGTLNKLYGDLVDIKMLWKKTNFIPDANSTLRLTYGYIKGYSPVDAVYYNPFTTLDGVIEKNTTGNEDFVIPDRLRELYEKKDYGKYLDKKLGSVPVALLYNMDTTGGNSGSPIFNAYGELVGVNFDRAYEATINDFAWNESYSRSIGVDMRYVAWVLDKYSHAENILKEVGL